MSTQFIEKDGVPAFAVVPIDVYEEMREYVEMHEDVKAYDLAMVDESETIPHKMVVRLIEGENPITVWREHRGLTGTQLARRSGVSASMISQIESGKKEASVKVMKSIAEALDVTLDEVC